VTVAIARVVGAGRQCAWLPAAAEAELRRYLFSSMSAFGPKQTLGFQRHRARRHGIRDGRAGSVTVIPRFGGGLNLNVHYQRAV